MVKLANGKFKIAKHVEFVFYHGLPCFLVVTTVNFRNGYFHVILWRVLVKIIRLFCTFSTPHNALRFKALQ